MAADWQDLGPLTAFQLAVTPALIGRVKLTVTHKDGEFGVISGVCNHAGGPLGSGMLEGDYVKCPWHNWKYHRCTGLGEPGFEEDAAPAYAVRVADGRLQIDMSSGTKRTRGHHEPHALARKVHRAPGVVRVAGISCTNKRVPWALTSIAIVRTSSPLVESGKVVTCLPSSRSTIATLCDISLTT